MNKTKRCHRLKALSVVGGFLDGMSIEFADGLNCLIGHRGTGKTTVLEFVRYALDEFPRDDGGHARKRVEALVKSNLGDGRIRLALETKDGLEYIVDRTASGDPMVLTADEQPTDVRINTAGIFSADIFSQNEVENIADSPQSQLELVDKFAANQIAEINGKVAGVRSGLDANGNAVIASRRQLDGLSDEVGTLSIIDSKIKALAEAQGDQKTDEVNVAHQHRAIRGRQEQAVQEGQDLIQRYRQWLQDAVGQFAQQSKVILDESILAGPNGKVMSDIRGVLNDVAGHLDRLFAQATETLDAGAEAITDLATALRHAHQQQELAFRDLIAKDNQARGVATERADLEKKRNDLLAKDRRKAELQKQLDQLLRERAELAQATQRTVGRAIRPAAADRQLDQRGRHLAHPRTDRSMR